MKRIYAGILALVLACIGLVAASTAASAHTPSVSATCDTLSVSLTKYQPTVEAKTTYTRWSYTPGNHDDNSAPTSTPLTDASKWQQNHKNKVGDDPVGVAFQQGNGDNASWFFWSATEIAAKSNHVVITINSASVADTDFGTAYSKELTFANRAIANTWTVTVTAYDDPDGSKGWTKTFSGTTTPCVPDKPKDIPPLVVTVDAGVASCGSTYVPTVTTTTTYTWVLENGAWVQHESATNVQGQRPLTEAEAEQYSVENCTEKPKDFDEVVWSEAGTPKCGESTVTQTGTRNFYTHTWDGTKYVKSLVKSEPTSRVVDVKVTPCPTETPTATPTPTPSVTTPGPSPSASETPVVSEVGTPAQLASTGSNGVLPGIILGAIAILVGVALVVAGRRRAQD